MVHNQNRKILIFFIYKKAFVKSHRSSQIYRLLLFCYTHSYLSCKPHLHTHSHTCRHTLFHTHTHTLTSHACTHTLSLSGKVKSSQTTTQLKKCQYKKQKQMPDNINACTPTHTNTCMQVSPMATVGRLSSML